MVDEPTIGSVTIYEESKANESMETQKTKKDLGNQEIGRIEVLIWMMDLPINPMTQKRL